MQLLDNPIRPYPWGSRTAIPELLGVEPSGEPQAELWMGAHDTTPSHVSGTSTSLADLIAADPAGELGASCLAEFGPKLPFLLKVLAAGEPVSLQAHPDPIQAKEGYERENADGIPLGAPHRNYKDPSAKPEMICALTPIEALMGFRAPAETLAVADALGVAALEPLLAVLREQPDGEGLRAVFTLLMTAPPDQQRAVVSAVLEACRARQDELETARLVVRLAERYPGDPGVVAAMLLDHVHLAPGEAVFLPPGNLHTYLEGVGVELLANSDNVLRGGLTTKHIDLPELLRVLDFTPGSTLILTVDANGDFDTPAPEFRLARLEVAGGAETTLPEAGPQILLCVGGSVVARSELGKVGLTQGLSAYAGARDGAVSLAGEGTVFRATSGLR